MNRQRAEITNWIFPVILYFIYPEIGGILLLLKIFFKIIKGLKNYSKSNRNTPFEEDNSQLNEIKPHDIDFSHDHDYNDNTSSVSSNYNKNSSSFDTEINVRCPVCNANNFINKIPTECEYCGNQILKI